MTVDVSRVPSVVQLAACLQSECDMPLPVNAGTAVVFGDYLAATPRAIQFRLYGQGGTVLGTASGSVTGRPTVVEPNGPGCGKDTILEASVAVAPGGTTYRQTR